MNLVYVTEYTTLQLGHGDDQARPRCALSFSQTMLIIAASRLHTPWQQLLRLLKPLLLARGTTRQRNRNRTRREEPAGL